MRIKGTVPLGFCAAAPMAVIYDVQGGYAGLPSRFAEGCALFASASPSTYSGDTTVDSGTLRIDSNQLLLHSNECGIANTVARVAVLNSGVSANLNAPAVEGSLTVWTVSSPYAGHSMNASPLAAASSRRGGSESNVSAVQSIS